MVDRSRLDGYRGISMCLLVTNMQTELVQPLQGKTDSSMQSNSTVGGATSQIGQNDRYQLGLQLTPPRTPDTAVGVRDRQWRRRRRYLTPLQRTTDQG